jgi:uncharacterized protein YaeQ
MAANATIHKALLNISNMDQNYYEEHNLTLAQHPSENDIRLMIRLVAFVLNANDTLMFTKGISQDDEPDLWQKSPGGDIIYTFKESLASTWFKQIENTLFRFKNLQVIHLNIDGDIESLYKRSMNIQCSVLDNELTLIDDKNNSVVITQDICKE